VWNDAIDSAQGVRHGRAPQHALDALLESSVDTPSREVMGWYGETSEPADFEFPDAVLEGPRVGVAIGVSRHKPSDEAWARYVVLLVTVLP
jgi:hypothetical protein